MTPPTFDPTEHEDEREERARAAASGEWGFTKPAEVKLPKYDPKTDHRAHRLSCPMRFALATLASGLDLPCRHGRLICESCDRCTCGSYPSFR